MGANAQTSVPTFTAGDVLTAANMNISARTGVPVFADTTARDAAFGGTGEKTLAEGQLCYIEASDVVQYYNGSSWATLGPASAGALVYVAGAGFTTSSAVAFANDTFTTTYQNYLVVINIGASNNTTLAIQVRDNAGTKSGANYYAASKGRTYLAADYNSNTNAGTSVTFCNIWNSGGNAAQTISLTVGSPAVASANTNWTGTFFADDTAGVFGGRYAVTEAHTGLVFTPAAGTISGNYRVYGIANS